MDIKRGGCQCGCGRPTPLAKSTRRGLVAGEPVRYLPGHASYKAGLAAAMKALASPAVQAKRLANLRAAFAARPKKTRPPGIKYGSQEWRDAIRAAVMRPETRARRSAWMKGRVGPTAGRVMPKTAEAKRLWWATRTPEQLAALTEKRSLAQRRRWGAMTHADKLAATKAGRDASAAKARSEWAVLTKEQRFDRMKHVWTAAGLANPSSIERIVAGLLDALAIDYERQAVIDKCTVDFLIPSKRLVIECDGTYWHGLPGRADTDRRRDWFLRSVGYQVLRLKEEDIKSGRAADTLKGVAV